MQLPLFVTCVLVFPQVPQDSEPTVLSPNLGLIVERVDHLPEGQRLGTPDGWIVSVDRAPTFVVTDTSEELSVRASSSAWYEQNNISLRITPDGSFVTGFFYMDVAHAPVTDVSGVACLLTDGVQSALEFEVSLMLASGMFQPLIGRVMLGRKGLEIAAELLGKKDESANLAEVFRSHAWSANDLHGDPRDKDATPHTWEQVAQGYVDHLGRRQGVWAIEDSLGNRLLDVSWRNGLVNGPVLHWKEGKLLSLYTYRNGALHGPTYDWQHEGGELRLVGEYWNNAPHGVWTSYCPNGLKAGEECWEYGVAVGMEKSRRADGVLEMKERSEPLSRVSAPPQQVVARVAKFQAELSEFHTRQKASTQECEK